MKFFIIFFYETVLSKALDNGYNEIIQLLLSNPKVDPNIIFKYI